MMSVANPPLSGVKTIHNFNAGPSILPREVFEQASHAILDFNNSGLSILEIGHRTPAFEAVMEEARSLVKELMQLDADHEVLFLHGGATTQFMQIPMNLLNENDIAVYTETGTWANKAVKEAKLFGHVEIGGSSKETNYTTIPKNLTVAQTAAYLHITTNETIAGTQWHNMPYDRGVPLVADMSSDILSRQLDFNKFDLIYAGAQKNMGAAGVNLVIVNKNILGKVSRAIPTILDYRNHIKEGSMLNTPPVFAVYVAMLTLRWLKNKGGVAAIEKENDAKAKLFYDTLDSLPVFKGPVAKEDRSNRNHIKEGSMLNTPPVFAVYVAMLTLRWLKNKGGVAAIEKENDAKAKLFYDTLDSLPVFKGPVAKEDRSKMNAVFVMQDAALEKEFAELCKKEGMYGIKGHRSVGGFRVSMYNALTIESVVVLTDLMKDFAQHHG